MLDILRPGEYLAKDESQEGRPVYILPSEEKIFVDPSFIHEGLQGPFDFLADYGEQLKDLQLPTQMDYKPLGVSHHFDNPLVRVATDNLTLLAKVGINRKIFGDSDFGVLYAANFTLGYTPVLEAATNKMDRGKQWTLVSPLRGGEVVHEITQALGYTPNIPIVRASRVVLKDGTYLIGIQDHNGSGMEIDNQVIFGDDCRAAAGSEDAVLRWVMGKNPAVSAVHSAIGVGVKKSGEILTDTWSSRNITYSSDVGAEANSMNEDYYLTVTEEERQKGRFPEECIYRVGDMGLAMSLRGERGDIIKPVIRAVAQNKLSPEMIYESTRNFINDPENLSLISRRLLNESKI